MYFGVFRETFYISSLGSFVTTLICWQINLLHNFTLIILEINSVQNSQVLNVRVVTTNPEPPNKN
jgi:hypothetical protein